MSLRRVIYLFNLIRWHTGTIEKPKTRFAEKQMCDAWNARRFAYRMILSLWVYMLVMIPNNNYPNTLRIIRVSFHQNSKTEKYRKYFFWSDSFSYFMLLICLFAALEFSRCWDDAIATHNVSSKRKIRFIVGLM